MGLSWLLGSGYRFVSALSVFDIQTVIIALFYVWSIKCTFHMQIYKL